MTLNRREFVLASPAALAAGAFGPSFVFAQAPAAPPATPVFTAVRRNVGIFTARGGTMGYIVNPGAVMVIDSQFADTSPGVPRRAQDADPAADRHPAQHAPSRGPHGRQQGAAARGHKDRRAPERAGASAEGRRGAEERRAPGLRRRDVHRRVEGHRRRETVSVKYYGAAHTSGDAVYFIERANIVHMAT